MANQTLRITKERVGLSLVYQLWRNGRCTSGLIHEEAIYRLIAQVKPTYAYQADRLIYQALDTKPET